MTAGKDAESESVYRLAEIGCKIHAQHVDLVCRLTRKGICPRCLESLSACGACHFQEQKQAQGFGLL